MSQTKASSKDKAAIEALADQIRHHRDLYYNGDPEISDAEFDALEDRLRELDPNHKVLGEVGAAPKADKDKDKEAEDEAKKLAKAQSIDALAKDLRAISDGFYKGDLGDAKHYKGLFLALHKKDAKHAALALVVPPRSMEWPKAQHELPMGSLNKVNTEEELQAWIKRCDEHAEKGKFDKIADDLAMTEKLDGISIELLYQDGEFEAAITRGDGTIGENITPNVARMKGVPGTIKQKGRVSVRGEIILRKTDSKGFVAFKKKTDPKFTELKSLRNTAAGQARTKEAKLLPGCKFITILCYDIEGVSGLKSEKEKISLIEKLGFSVPNAFFGKADKLVKKYKEYEDKLRKKLDYDIDGLVIRANIIRSQDLLGELNNRPRGAVAFKFGNEMQVTALEGILWSTGDTGRITPVAQISPVFLAGAEVRQASLHNLANVKELGIGIGDQVMVSRRNDVIPYVEKVVVKGKKTAEAPKVCATCNAKVFVEGEYLVCRNLDCPALRVGRMKTWIKHMGLLDWGAKTFERIYEEGLAKEPADLYKLKKEDIANMEGYGETSAKKLLEPLAEKKELPMATFIAALGIETVSKETAKLLVGAGYDTVDALKDATVEELAKIEGLGDIKAQKITEGFKGRLPEIERLKQVGVIPIKLADGGPLAGLSFCFSGSHSKPRKVLHNMVEGNGGNVASGVKKGLTYLVLSDPNSSSSKAQKARKLGTEIIDEAGMEKIIKAKGGKLDA